MLALLQSQLRRNLRIPRHFLLLPGTLELRVLILSLLVCHGQFIIDRLVS